MSLVTGALPAEYGLRTAGIIDITTKSGLLAPGGSVSVYGGSHGTIEPSFTYGGGAGSFSYLVTGDFLRNDLGIESPDGRVNPIHDHTKQSHGFGYFEDILYDENRVALMLGSSVGTFQIPNQSGLQPGLGLTVNGVADFPSDVLNENQREITQFAALSWQHSAGAFDVQTSLISRYSSLTFRPDELGDLLYDGVSQQAFKKNVAYGLQSDAAYRLNESHTVRGGLFVQTDHSVSETTSAVLLTDDAGAPLSDIPASIIDNGTRTEWIYSAYLQDEWKLVTNLTINYGLRFDKFNAYSSANQFSPRLNIVWEALPGTILHAGFSRYLSPPPFELVGGETISKFANTTSPPASPGATPPLPERAYYYDLGVQQKVMHDFMVGIDTYYKRSHNLIDEGQFGAPIILTPFNYLYGLQYGAEFTANYTKNNFMAYFNFAAQSAKGRQIDSAQFNFAPEDLAYITNNTFISITSNKKARPAGSPICGKTRASAWTFSSGRAFAPI